MKYLCVALCVFSIFYASGAPNGIQNNFTNTESNKDELEQLGKELEQFGKELEQFGKELKQVKKNIKSLNEKIYKIENRKITFFFIVEPWVEGYKLFCRYMNNR